MSKEKQIEEMAVMLGDCCNDVPIAVCETTPCDHCKAKYLYEAGYRKQEWIGVDERLPEIRQRVLLYSYHDGVNTGYRADEIGRFYVDKSYPYRPTHWMPLPEAPKMKGGAE